MRINFLALLLIFALAGIPVVGFAAPAQQAPTPTPPDVPVDKTDTPVPPTRPPGGGDSGPTRTPKPGGGAWPTRTATPTITPTPTPTLRQAQGDALTSTPTPTPIVTYLTVLVYMDTNGDRVYNQGEGVKDLWLVVKAGVGANGGSPIILGASTQDGQANFTLPDSVAPESEVQVQIPYLHRSLETRAAGSIGGSVTFEIQLEAPHYPIYLP